MSEPRNEIRAKAAEQRKQRTKEFVTGKTEYNDIIDYQVISPDPILQRDDKRYVNS